MTMKKLGKIKLDQLNKAELSEKELNRLLGGENCCLCACAGPSGPVSYTHLTLPTSDLV